MNEDSIIKFMKLGLNDANNDARQYAYNNFHQLQELMPKLSERIWNECDESVHKNLNKTFTSLNFKDNNNNRELLKEREKPRIKTSSSLSHPKNDDNLNKIDKIEIKSEKKEHSHTTLNNYKEKKEIKDKIINKENKIKEDEIISNKNVSKSPLLKDKKQSENKVIKTGSMYNNPHNPHIQNDINIDKNEYQPQI